MPYRFVTGSRACDTHLYKRDAYPLDLIAPATILWRPAVNTPQAAPISTNQRISQRAKQRGTTRGKGKEKDSLAAQVPEDQRVVWVWVHPSVFEEVFKELRVCVSLVLEKIKIANPSSQNSINVEIADLRQHLNVFEIMGPKSSQVIRGALKPVFEEGRDDFKKVLSA